MKKFLFILSIIFSFFAVGIKAQNAKTILDKTAAAYKKAGNVRIGFDINVNGSASSGTIFLSGNKFQCSTSGMVVWFDGKTMWNYVVANDEVNVTNPGVAEVARMNPYSFLNMYKKGYKCSMGKSTSKEYEIVMAGDSKAPFKKVVVRVAKKSYQPSYVMMESANATTTVKVKSYQKNQKFSASTFTFNKKKYPDAEIIDLR